jgi:hypothetical protein
MAEFSGGCVCGAVRYECDAEPIVMVKCHCRDCQRTSGGAFIPVVYVPSSAFRITKGLPRYYSTESIAGGSNKRGFCGECGSRLTGAESTRGIGITAGSLDDPSMFRPSIEIHVADAQAWDHLDPVLAKFDGYPPHADART